MQENSFQNTYKQKAMFHGTILGVLRMIGFITMVMYMKISPTALNGENTFTFLLLFVLTMGISISIPFVAGTFAINYRKKFCSNRMDYIQAFKYTAIIYICSALLFATLQALYFSTIDNGMYMNSYQTFIATLGEMMPYNQQTMESFETLSQQAALIKNSDFVFSTLLNNLFAALYMPAIIALFVRKNQQ